HSVFLFDHAFDFLREFRPGVLDLILLDVSMPDMDGFEVLRHIREQDSKVPVVAITAHAGRNQRRRAYEAGFCDYFSKPILDLNKFCKRVHLYIERGCTPGGEESAA